MCSMKIKTLVFASAFLFMTTSQNGVYAENRSDDNAGIYKEAEVLRNKEGDIIGIDVTDEPDMTDYDTVDFDNVKCPACGETFSCVCDDDCDCCDDDDCGCGCEH